MNRLAPARTRRTPAGFPQKIAIATPVASGRNRLPFRPGRTGPVNFRTNEFMSQHRSLRAATTAGASKRNVLKRFERVALLKSRGQWSDGDRVTNLRKTKPAE